LRPAQPGVDWPGNPAANHTINQTLTSDSAPASISTLHFKPERFHTVRAFFVSSATIAESAYHPHEDAKPLMTNEGEQHE
jgi:hypothetical protein